MEKQKGKFIAYSDKTKSACIDMGEGQDWHKVQSNAQQYFKKVEKGSECSFGFDGEELVFVKQESSGNKETSKQTNDSNKYNMQMSQLKNRINARTSALENATKIAIADENLDTQEKMHEAIKTIRAEFLEFIEGEGDTPSS